MLSLNCRVILLSFNGILSTPEHCEPSENYWELIGERGTVIEKVNERGRVLVKFDNTVSDLGLQCHNPIPNSLYILETDLKKA
jgi:membrane protein implicated in regulation of membrane protease activity